MAMSNANCTATNNHANAVSRGVSALSSPITEIILHCERLRTTTPPRPARHSTARGGGTTARNFAKVGMLYLRDHEIADASTA